MKIHEVLKHYIVNKKELRLKAHGNSMVPAINDGDMLLIDYDISILNSGDIILYYPNDGKDVYIAHRIIRIIKNTIFITKGDNNDYTDRPIRKKQIIGKIVLIMRGTLL